MTTEKKYNPSTTNKTKLIAFRCPNDVKENIDKELKIKRNNGEKLTQTDLIVDLIRVGLTKSS